jgi:hypothetical protein
MMPGQLEPPQSQNGYQVADVQAGCRGVEPRIERYRPPGEPRRESAGVRYLKNIPPELQIFQDVHNVSLQIDSVDEAKLR